MFIHIVQDGETLYSIAEKYGTYPAKIMTDNGIGEDGRIVVGQALLIIIPDISHTVKAGETLAQIAANYNTTVADLLRENYNITNPDYIQENQIITIKANTHKQGTLLVNGYVYPNVDKEVLEKTLPYLSRLTIFGYEFKPDGELIPTPDSYLIEKAYEYGAEPIMLISNITNSGGFDSEHMQSLLTNTRVQDNLINNILQTLKAKGYRGIDLDFEYIPTNMRNYYTNFVRKITGILNNEGFSVNVDVAPKTTGNQQGLLFEAHDYEGLGQAANTVFLMTYEWGYSRSEPRAVAPSNEVYKVLQYAVSQIPPEKILMGIPNYGYDWKLPYERGKTVAKSIGNLEGQNLATQAWSPIKYDNVAETPYFRFKDEGGILNEVWFEDARSIYAKLMLVMDFDLRGIGIWNVMREFPQLYILLNYLFVIEKPLEG